MGVEMTQHPEMWNAVVIQVPLLDMLRFEHIAAGASWVGEYGSVSIPDERAFLASISPYNQLKPDVKYPEPLILHHHQRRPGRPACTHESSPQRWKSSGSRSSTKKSSKAATPPAPT